MAEVIVTWPAQLVALTAVVILVTLDPDAVLDVGCDTRVPDGLPLVSRVHHAGVDVPLDQILLTVLISGVVPVPGFQDECVRTRPGELKGDGDLSRIAYSVGVLGISKREYISTENVSRSRTKGALAGCGDFGLVLLQTHFKVSITFVPHAALVLRVPCAVATFPVPQLAVYIFYSNQLQLKIARGLGHLRPYR